MHGPMHGYAPEPEYIMGGPGSVLAVVEVVLVRLVREVVHLVREVGISNSTN